MPAVDDGSDVSKTRSTITDDLKTGAENILDCTSTAILNPGIVCYIQGGV